MATKFHAKCLKTPVALYPLTNRISRLITLADLKKTRAHFEKYVEKQLKLVDAYDNEPKPWFEAERATNFVFAVLGCGDQATRDTLMTYSNGVLRIHKGGFVGYNVGAARERVPVEDKVVLGIISVEACTPLGCVAGDEKAVFDDWEVAGEDAGWVAVLAWVYAAHVSGAGVEAAAGGL